MRLTSFIPNEIQSILDPYLKNKLEEYKSGKMSVVIDCSRSYSEIRLKLKSMLPTNIITYLKSKLYIIHLFNPMKLYDSYEVYIDYLSMFWILLSDVTEYVDYTLIELDDHSSFTIHDHTSYVMYNVHESNPSNYIVKIFGLDYRYIIKFDSYNVERKLDELIKIDKNTQLQEFIIDNNCYFRYDIEDNTHQCLVATFSNKVTDPRVIQRFCGLAEMYVSDFLTDKFVDDIIIKINNESLKVNYIKRTIHNSKSYIIGFNKHQLFPSYAGDLILMTTLCDNDLGNIPIKCQICKPDESVNIDELLHLNKRVYVI